MSKLKFLHRWLHEVLGLHEFALKRKDGAFVARCTCGAFLKRWK